MNRFFVNRPFVLITYVVVWFFMPGTVLAQTSITETPIDDVDRDHWSFQPIGNPTPPNVDLKGWPSGPIDRFILRKLEERQIKPAPEADRTTLLRRLNFNLLGLPPSPEQIDRFVSDTGPNAYARLVDQLLSSQAYGERWAQFWLDLARFAETDGFEHDRVRKDAWKYRQWVIDALNNDMPYDQFVRMQLAGDLINNQHAIATMFCMAGPDMPDINEQDLRRHDKMNELTSTVGSVLLGLQMHCAQCHDHKYDPISQADFYRLRGVFEGSVPEMKRDRHVVQLSLQTNPVKPRIYFRGELSGIGPELDPRPPRIANSKKPTGAFGNNKNNPRIAFAEWLFAKDNPLTARVIANRIWQQHFGKSLCENPSDFGLIADGPTHPELLDYLATQLQKSNWSLKHLHRSILLSSTYRQASRPPLQSQIAESQATGPLLAGPLSAWEHALKQDPTNELNSRFPRRRLEGEAIRDAMLYVSGQVNSAYGGPSVMPNLPQELRSTLLKGQWTASKRPADHARRSIYVFPRRNLRYPIFEVFDRPDAGASCACRDRSTTAIQSLQLLNGDLAFEAAEHLCDRLMRGSQDAEKLIEQLFLTTLSRRPSERESKRLMQVLGRQPSIRQSNLGESSPQESSMLRKKLLSACLAVLNASEFVYVD